jgi:hypothetical protein
VISNSVSVRKYAIAALLACLMLCNSVATRSAEVKYQHPDLTIVAEDEPLDTVLKSLGREMRIFVTVPTGFNPTVECNVQNQPIKQALKTLLGDMSYSLEWESGGERLAGLTIFGSDARSTAGTSPTHNTQNPARTQTGPRADGTASQGDGLPATAGNASPVSTEPDPDAMERDAQMEAERAEHEARMAEEREAHEAEMALRHQEEAVAQEARMKEETARHEAEMRAYIEAQGLRFPD